MRHAVRDGIAIERSGDFIVECTNVLLADGKTAVDAVCGANSTAPAVCFHSDPSRGLDITYNV